MKPLGKMIPLSRCKNGVVYEIHSRNLQVGVFVKERAGFIGIREKFGRLYLFMEFHYATGAPYGTARPLKRLRAVPKGIPLCEHFETVDEATKRPVEFDRPIADGGRGWYFLDTGEASEKIKGVFFPNTKLFKFLAGIEKTVTVKCKKCKLRFTRSRLDRNGHCSICQLRIKHERQSAPTA